MWIDVNLPLAVAQESQFKICGKQVITIAEEISDEIVTESILDCTELNIEIEKGHIECHYVNPVDGSTSPICLQYYTNDTAYITETPLIPRPESDFSAIYASLKRAEGVSIWVCGESATVVVSLDLDLFEKCHFLVGSSNSLSKRHFTIRRVACCVCSPSCNWYSRVSMERD